MQNFSSCVTLLYDFYSTMISFQMLEKWIFKHAPKITTFKFLIDRKFALRAKLSFVSETINIYYSNIICKMVALELLYYIVFIVKRYHFKYLRNEFSNMHLK